MAQLKMQKLFPCRPLLVSFVFAALSLSTERLISLPHLFTSHTSSSSLTGIRAHMLCPVPCFTIWFRERDPTPLNASDLKRERVKDRCSIRILTAAATARQGPVERARGAPR